MTFNCLQCGGKNEVSEKERFIKCSYCDSSLYIDINKITNHFYLQPTITKEVTSGILRRWAHSKELKGSLNIDSINLKFFPVWYFVLSDNRRVVELAAPTQFISLKTLVFPHGELKFFLPQLMDTEEFIIPSVFYESALSKVQGESKGATDVAKSSLVHIPFYFIKFTYGSMPTEALIHGTTGEIIIENPPRSSKRRMDVFFAMAMTATFFVFSLEGFLIKEFLTRLIINLISAVPLYFFSRYIVSMREW